MDIERIHFMREVLVTDHKGTETARMQISYDNEAYVKPNFMEVTSTDQAQVRELYLELGGGRPVGWWSGSTVIIPNRTRWDLFWRNFI